jgi:hypothetical protein
MDILLVAYLFTSHYQVPNITYVTCLFTSHYQVPNITYVKPPDICIILFINQVIPYTI